MRLGSGTYKEIALDALKGNWVKAAVAGLFANWLGVFSSSFIYCKIRIHCSNSDLFSRISSGVLFDFIYWNNSDRTDLLFYWRACTPWIY